MLVLDEHHFKVTSSGMVDLAGLMGRWYGTTLEDSFEHYREVEVFTRSTNEEHIYLRYLNRAYEEPPEALLDWKTASSFQCQIPNEFTGDVMTLSGEYDSRSAVLTLKIDGSLFDGENFIVQLRRDDPSCRRFQIPSESLNYAYRIPSAFSGRNYFPPADAATHGLSTADVTDTVTALLRLNSGGKHDAQVDGVLILKDGKLVLEEYFWGLSPDDLHDISSCTKSLTSILFGIAWDKGLLDLEDVVSDAFPDVQTDWNKGQPIRLKHLLSMTTGTTMPDEAAAIAILKSEGIAAEVLAAKRVADPGAVWQYDNTMPLLAGLFLEKKTGISVETFADEHLFRPLGIDRHRWVHLPQKSIDGSPLVMTTGALGLTLRDFAKLGQLMLDEGMYGGQRVVSEEWIRLSAKQFTEPGQWPYGLYWHLNTEDQRHLSSVDGFLALGQGEQVIAVLPELNMVVAWMSSTWVNKFGYRVGMRVIDENFIRKIQK